VGTFGVIAPPDGYPCCMVLVGVRADGRKDLAAVADGFRESEESWSEVLRDLKRREMRAPVLAVGDGALGFWAALREVFAETREQPCWVHKIARVLDALPALRQRRPPGRAGPRRRHLRGRRQGRARRSEERRVTITGRSTPKRVWDLP
jgi:transposase-like protein